MPVDRRQFVAASLLSAGIAPFARAEADAPTLSLRGRVACLTEALQKDYQLSPDCDKRGHVYALQTVDGKFYPFLPLDTAAAVWMDERYRTRDLQLTVRLFPQANFIEVIKFQSWVGGRLYNLDYYCEIGRAHV